MKVNRLTPFNCRKPAVLFFVLGLCVSGFAEEVCELYFETCLENFDGDTIFVPPEVIALSSKIYACDPTRVIEGMIDSSAPPSIVFVIDHSYSMAGWGNTYPGNDTYGTRFRVTRDLIDTIYKIHPDAEIGLVVFREVLYFDHRNNDLFEPLEGYGDQSFMPLLQLDSKVSGNTTGLQALRSILETDTVSKNTSKNGMVEAVDLKYQPQFATIGNTNINNAFAAALQAMQSATNPKERQFIIFLSDGEPFPLTSNDDHGGKDPFYFSQGLNTPSTFTVYLDNEKTTAPQCLQDLTENVRENGYSTSNPSSDIWVLKTDYEALMSLFMRSVMKPILTVISGAPVSMTINTLISDSLTDSGFVFSERFPLSANTTSLNVKINYHLINNNTGAQKDTQTVTSVYITRKEDAVLPAGVEKICWDKGSLSLNYNGQPVTLVDETMLKLEVKFNPGDATYESVTVQVTHKQGESPDIENMQLDLESASWTREFERGIADPVRGDNALQHQMLDSIIVVYRNPKLPLDTLRVSVPFSISKTIKFPSATYNDRNADGFVDSIFIGVSGIFSSQDLKTLADLIAFPDYRNFIIDSMEYATGGLIYYVKDGLAVPQTYVTDKDIIQLKQGLLPAGGLVAGGTINVRDKMAPVINTAQLVVSATGDSVRVTFSEPVKSFSSSEPFLFRKTDGNSIEVFLDADGILSNAGSVYTARIRQVKDNKYVSTGDSIWINTAAAIADTVNNVQLSSGNRRVQMSVKQIPYDVVPRVVNNPLSPFAQIPPVVIDAYAEAGRPLPSKSRGMVIVVEPEDGNLRPGVKLSGKASIYDVVKNPIIENKPMIEKNGYLYFAWDGINSKGRKVSSGTYVAILSITDNQSPPVTKNKIIRIGVKR